MKSKKTGQKALSQQESQLIEQLREHPAMMARVQSILEIVRNAGGPLKTADEVEEELIENQHATFRLRNKLKGSRGLSASMPIILPLRGSRT